MQSKDMENLNSLLPISENNGKKAVNARALHAFLGSKRDFSTWIKDRIKSYDFVENQDYVVFPNFGEYSTPSSKSYFSLFVKGTGS